MAPQAWRYDPNCPLCVREAGPHDHPTATAAAEPRPGGRKAMRVKKAPSTGRAVAAAAPSGAGAAAKRKKTVRPKGILSSPLPKADVADYWSSEAETTFTSVAESTGATAPSRALEEDDEGESAEHSPPSKHPARLAFLAESEDESGEEDLLPSAVRESESRVRALAHEAGRLREALREETKRRERCNIRAREAEEGLVEQRKLVNELSFSNKQLVRELAATKEAAAEASARNRRAIAGLREGLEAVEEAVVQRAAESYPKLQALFTHLNALQAILLRPPHPSQPLGPGMEAAAPGEGAGYLAPPVAAVEVQALFADSMATLSSLSASLAAPDGPGGAAGLLAASSGGAPADSSALLAEVGRVEMAADNSSRARAAAEEGGERSRLVAEVAQLRVELAREREGSDAVKMIPEYRVAIVKYRVAARALQDRLEEAGRERATLRDEIEVLKGALAAREAQQSAAVGAAHQGRAAAEHEAARVTTYAEAHLGQLEERARVLHVQVESERAGRRRVEEENINLRAMCAELEEKSVHQAAAIAELQATVAEYRADVRHAVGLYMKRAPGFAAEHAAPVPPPPGARGAWPEARAAGVPWPPMPAAFVAASGGYSVGGQEEEASTWEYLSLAAQRPVPPPPIDAAGLAMHGAGPVPAGLGRADALATEAGHLAGAGGDGQAAGATPTSGVEAAVAAAEGEAARLAAAAAGVGAGGSGGVGDETVDALRRDMAALDAELAEIETTLHAASHRVD